MTLSEAVSEVKQTSPALLGPLAPIVREWSNSFVEPEAVLELAAQMRPSELVAWMADGQHKINRRRRPKR